MISYVYQMIGCVCYQATTKMAIDKCHRQYKMPRNPPHKRCLVLIGCNSPFMRIAERLPHGALS